MNPEKVNGLFVTESICYPRSGHQALLDVLTEYFEGAISYCEMYVNPEKQIDLEPYTNYQKNHDFDSVTEIKSDRKYVVQIRNPFDAIASRWEMEVRAGVLQDNEWEYRRVMAEWADYWSKFVTKWVFSDIPNRLIVAYEDLLESPHDVIGNVIQFVQGSPNIDSARLTDSLLKYPLKLRAKKRIPRVHFA